jgi:hypothetical protein
VHVDDQLHALCLEQLDKLVAVQRAVSDRHQ